MDTIVTPVTVITLDSTRIEHSIKADLVARYFPPVVRLVQYDQSLPVIAVSLMQNGQTYTLPSGAAANIRVHKPDSTYVYNPALGCDSTRKIVYFEVTQAMAAANGDGLAIVEIVVDGDIAGTSLITLHFEENPVPEDAIESSDEWETIYELGERIIASTVTPVSTAAGMTDHNVVYLYTGTESGWNQGHMYYYNGTTWVDAGIAVTDTTLSVAGLAADAKKTGDEIADLKDGLSAVEDDVTALKEDIQTKVDLPKEITDVSLTVQTGYYTASGFTSAGGFKAAKESVTEGETLLLTGSGNTYAYAYYFVNDSGTVISKADTALEMTDYRVVVPNDATYIEINTSGTNKVIGLKRLSYDADFDLSKYIVQPTTENEELELTWDSGYRVNGTTLSPNGGYRSVVIPVSSGEVYDVVIYFKESWFYGVYLYDSNMTRLATYITGDGTTTRRYEQEISITSNGYMVVNAAAWNYFRAVYKVIALSADDRIEKLESTPWTGKTIWWCGTSIPANGAPVGEENLSYPAYVGKLLGANVINKAISSSCARRGWKNKETESDPYGWTDVAWQNVFLAMGANLTEKQDLIDNYSTWKNIIGGDFDGSGSDGTGTGKPESLTQEWIDKINASSYENVLMPYLDGTYDMPDLFVFDHGHNDYGNGETFAEMTTQPSDAYDRSTFIGAMSFFFEQIFVANPHAKIVIISHYANDTGKQNTITTAQNNLANLWDLPIFDIYDKLGWSQQVITTTGYWDASTAKWVNSGGAEQQISMLWVHLRDGLHPSSDQSGKAIVQIGREIAQYLENNIVAEQI